MGSAIESIVHMPRVPVQPGIGFFSSLYEGRLSLVISYRDGMITAAEAERLAAGIRRTMGVPA
jgi:hypothetical protein